MECTPPGETTMLDDLAREEVTQTIDAMVTELLESAGYSAPPVDAIVLAQRHLGMVVCLDRNQPQRGRAQRAAAKKQIYLRPEPSEERHQWRVAHGICADLRSALLEKVGIAPRETPATPGGVPDRAGRLGARNPAECGRLGIDSGEGRSRGARRLPARSLWPTRSASRKALAERVPYSLMGGQRRPRVRRGPPLDSDRGYKC